MNSSILKIFLSWKNLIFRSILKQLSQFTGGIRILKEIGKTLLLKISKKYLGLWILSQLIGGLELRLQVKFFHSFIKCSLIFAFVLYFDGQESARAESRSYFSHETNPESRFSRIFVLIPVSDPNFLYSLSDKQSRINDFPISSPGLALKSPNS